MDELFRQSGLLREKWDDDPNEHEESDTQKASLEKDFVREPPLRC